MKTDDLARSGATSEADLTAAAAIGKKDSAAFDVSEKKQHRRARRSSDHAVTKSGRSGGGSQASCWPQQSITADASKLLAVGELASGQARMVKLRAEKPKKLRK